MDKIMNQNHLYFIVINSDGNMFGHYHDNIINSYFDYKYNYDDNIFIITLHNNRGSEINI